MQAREALQKHLKQIATGAFGQTPEFRHFMGRQVMTFNRQTGIMFLPHVVGTETELGPQITDQTDLTNYGKLWFMADHDELDDSTKPIK